LLQRGAGKEEAVFDHDQLRLGVELIYRPRGRLRRFRPGTRYRRVLATCCAALPLISVGEANLEAATRI
jgi:hypothetical protein